MEGYLPEKTCRTCLQKSEELTSLNSTDDDTGLTLLEKLRFCASIQVVVSERTPSNACAQCVRCIAEYYDFKRRCELSEKTLEDLCREPSAYTVTKIEVDYGEVEVADTTVIDEDLCNEPSAYTATKIEVDYGEVEVTDTTVIGKTESDEDLCKEVSAYTATNIEVDYGEEEGDDSAESDILDLFCDDDSKRTPCVDGEEEVDVRMHPCDVCSSSFATAESLQRHKKFCHKENRHGCDRCDASFRSSSRLRIHKEIHKDVAKYICDTCGKSYSFLDSLRIHIEENHAAEPKVYECDVCGRTYNFISSLHSHRRSHMPVDPRYTCDRCGRSFRKRYLLARHVQAAHEKPHACDQCDKRFSQKSKLLKHKAHHVKVMAKPYSCELCDRRFSTKAAVAFHVRTLHKSGKELKCDVCGMVFYNRYNYAAHYSSHTGVKPYRCDGCRAGFNYNSAFLAHKKKCASLLALTQQ